MNGNQASYLRSLFPGPHVRELGIVASLGAGAPVFRHPHMSHMGTSLNVQGGGRSRLLGFGG